MRHNDSQTDCPLPQDRQGQRYLSSCQGLPDSAMCQVDPKLGQCTVHHHGCPTKHDGNDNNTLTLEEISVIEGPYMRNNQDDVRTPPYVSNFEVMEEQLNNSFDNINNHCSEVCESQFIGSKGKERKTQHIGSSLNNPSISSEKQSIPPMSQRDMTWAKYLSCPSNEIRHSSKQTLDNKHMSLLQCQKNGYVLDTDKGSDLGKFMNLRNSDFKMINPEMEEQSKWSLNLEQRNVGFPQHSLASMNIHKHKHSSNMYPIEELDTFFMSDNQKVSLLK